jgi:hypothetical protein
MILRCNLGPAGFVVFYSVKNPLLESPIDEYHRKLRKGVPMLAIPSVRISKPNDEVAKDLGLLAE